MYKSSDTSQFKCPFCSRTLEEPEEISTRFGSSFTGGKCECGGVYVYDRSGHNLGEAYVDALAFACGGDYDMAWSLTPEQDYELVEMSYDSRRNKLSAQRKSRSAFLFVKLRTNAKPD